MREREESENIPKIGSKKPRNGAIIIRGWAGIGGKIICLVLPYLVYNAYCMSKRKMSKTQLDA